MGIVSLATSFALAGIAVGAMLIPANEIARQKGAAENSPVIEETAAGEWELKTPGLEKIEFIHRKKGYGKSEETSKAVRSPACYKFLTPTKVKWTVLPVNYRLNPDNPQGLAENFIRSAISTSAETWDGATSKELMNNSFTIDHSVAYGVQDYKNALVFGNYSAPEVIAVTSVWYNPATKTIVEFDILFDTDWNWGDATVDPAKMDLQNIAVHELGHGVGLADVYENACSAVTMYGYSNYGETDKRTLEQPDITGLRTLYGL